MACSLTNIPAATVTTAGLEKAKLSGRFCKMSGKGFPNAIDERVAQQTGCHQRQD
jgi:hypothetical protein